MLVAIKHTLKPIEQVTSIADVFYCTLHFAAKPIVSTDSKMEHLRHYLNLNLEVSFMKSLPRTFVKPEFLLISLKFQLSVVVRVQCSEFQPGSFVEVVLGLVVIGYRANSFRKRWHLAKRISERSER